MPLDEPSWWYSRSQHPTDILLRSVLQPIATIYGAVAGSRMRRKPVERVPIPVVCIGNFTAGGTGKTPLALKIAQLLRDAGQTPVFLSRGFGGSVQGPHLVDATVDQATEVGDEPLLLAASGPTVIARDRAAGARFIVARGLGSIVIMDDGLQNPALAKDLRIAVVDRERGIGNGRVIPAGPLRADIGQQVALTDAIVVTHQLTSVDQQMACPPALPGPLEQFEGHCFSATVEPSRDVDWITSKPILAFAGIGNPDRFFKLLQMLGGDVRERHAFRDHHSFRDEELARLLADAERSNLQLVTTEKDFVRLDKQSVHARLVRDQSRVLQVQTAFSADDEHGLTKLLLGIISRAEKFSQSGDSQSQG